MPGLQKGLDKWIKDVVCTDTKGADQPGQEQFLLVWGQGLGQKEEQGPALPVAT